MNKYKNYIKINKQSWNRKTSVHVKSEFYDLEGFLRGNNSLNEIELNLLGDIHGKTLLHLQCHFGQDSISLSRLGAKVTGVDFSDKAIDVANQLLEKTKNHIEFICCDIYDLPNYLDKKFDIVFTSYGTIGWLPDLARWGKVISTFLKPNGRLVFAEFHPVVWMFDDQFDKIEYNYFNTGPIVEVESGTYADRNADIKQENISWNHSISEVLNNLIKNGIEISSFEEYDYSPYNCFNETIKIEPNKYRIKHLDNKIPMVYSVVGKKI